MLIIGQDIATSSPVPAFIIRVTPGALRDIVPVLAGLRTGKTAGASGLIKKES